jgi:hypothetical protein
MPGPAHLRHYAGHRVVAWQPHGVLDDRLADEIVEWVSVVEKNSPPFDRFVDFSCLAKISLSIGHVFTIARERAWKYGGTEAVKSAFFCEELVGFGMARLFETLMEESPIKVRAFRDRAAAVKWLGVPAEILNLQLDPQPSDNSTRARV